MYRRDVGGVGHFVTRTLVAAILVTAALGASQLGGVKGAGGSDAGAIGGSPGAQKGRTASAASHAVTGVVPGHRVLTARVGAAIPPTAGGVQQTATPISTVEPNWVLTKVTTQSPTRIKSPYGVTGRLTGTGPLVVGVGISSLGGPNSFTWFYVERLGGGPIAASFTAGPFHRRLRFDVLSEGGIFWLSPVNIDETASVLAVLLFTVNGVIDTVEWSPTTEGIPFSSSVRFGTGATALTVGTPSGGVTVAAGGAGGGTASYRETVATGIVGAMEYLTCEVCAGTWTAPGATPHKWVSARHHAWPVCWCGSVVAVHSQFAGPAGPWHWLWSGVVVPVEGGGPLAEPVAAAYAPIGSDWWLFAECRGSGECALL